VVNKLTVSTPLKNDGVSNSWDYDVPNTWKNKIHVPNHQPAMVFTMVMLSYVESASMGFL
jgi:hypothetical protein